jgi:hypothetical protein
MNLGLMKKVFRFNVLSKDRKTGTAFAIQGTRVSEHVQTGARPMTTQFETSIVRTLVGTVGALAIGSSLLLFAAGPARAETQIAQPFAIASMESMEIVSTARPIAY